MHAHRDGFTMIEQELRALAIAGAKGDAAATEALARAALEPLPAFLYMLGVPKADIDDVAQNTLIQMCRSLARYDPEQPFSPWLRAIARHMVAKFWRGRLRERENRGVFRDYVEQVTDRDEAVDPVIANQKALESCIEQLPVKQREVLAMTYFEGCTSDDVSWRMGTTPGAIRQILLRTREALRRCIEAKSAAALE